VITNPYDEEKEREIMYLTLNHITIKDDDNDEQKLKKMLKRLYPFLN
jgi:hypothetical protein